MKSAIINAKLTGHSAVKIIAIHIAAKIIGVQVKVDGIPFGAKRKYPEGSFTGTEKVGV